MKKIYALILLIGLFGCSQAQQRRDLFSNDNFGVRDTIIFQDLINGKLQNSGEWIWHDAVNNQITINASKVKITGILVAVDTTITFDSLGLRKLTFPTANPLIGDTVISIGGNKNASLVITGLTDTNRLQLINTAKSYVSSSRVELIIGIEPLHQPIAQFYIDGSGTITGMAADRGDPNYYPENFNLFKFNNDSSMIYTNGGQVAMKIRGDSIFFYLPLVAQGAIFGQNSQDSGAYFGLYAEPDYIPYFASESTLAPTNFTFEVFDTTHDGTGKLVTPSYMYDYVETHGGGGVGGIADSLRLFNITPTTNQTKVTQTALNIHSIGLADSILIWRLTAYYRLRSLGSLDLGMPLSEGGAAGYMTFYNPTNNYKTYIQSGVPAASRLIYLPISSGTIALAESLVSATVHRAYISDTTETIPLVTKPMIDPNAMVGVGAIDGEFPMFVGNDSLGSSGITANDLVGVGAINGYIPIWVGTDSLGSSMWTPQRILDSLNAMRIWMRALNAIADSITSGTLPSGRIPYVSGGGGGGVTSTLILNFTATDTVDTATIAGATSYDSYVATPMLMNVTTVLNDADKLTPIPDSGRVFIKRKTSGSNGLVYSLWHQSMDLALPSGVTLNEVSSTAIEVVWVDPASSQTRSARTVDTVVIAVSTSGWDTVLSQVPADRRYYNIIGKLKDTITVIASTKYYMAVFPLTDKQESDTIDVGCKDSLTTGAGAPAAHHLAFYVQPTEVEENEYITPAVKVRVLDSGGNLMGDDTREITIAIGTNPSGGVLAGDKINNAVGGEATFTDLSIDKDGNGYTLIASASPLTGATSSDFSVINPPSAFFNAKDSISSLQLWTSSRFINGKINNDILETTDLIDSSGNNRTFAYVQGTLPWHKARYKTNQINSLPAIALAYRDSGSIRDTCAISCNSVAPYLSDSGTHKPYTVVMVARLMQSVNYPTLQIMWSSDTAATWSNWHEGGVNLQNYPTSSAMRYIRMYHSTGEINYQPNFATPGIPFSWHIWEWVYDGTNISMYIDGNIIGTETSVSVSPSTTDMFSIGAMVYNNSGQQMTDWASLRFSELLVISKEPTTTERTYYLTWLKSIYGIP